MPATQALNGLSCPPQTLAGFPGFAAPSPFTIVQQQMTQLVMTTPAQKPGLVTTSGSGGSSLGGSGSRSGSLPNPYLVSSGGGFYSINPPPPPPQQQQQQNGAPGAPGPLQQLQAQAAAAVQTLQQVQQQHQQQRQQVPPKAVKAKQKAKRTYKRPEQLQEERKQTAVANVGALPSALSACRMPPACCTLRSCEGATLLVCARLTTPQPTTTRPSLLLPPRCLSSPNVEQTMCPPALPSCLAPCPSGWLTSHHCHRHRHRLQEHIRRLELQLGRAKVERDRLALENRALQSKAVVLSKHTSFRRCAAQMVEELAQVGGRCRAQSVELSRLGCRRLGGWGWLLEWLCSLCAEQMVEEPAQVGACLRVGGLWARAFFNLWAGQRRQELAGWRRWGGGGAAG